jgi:hypothetical protein
MRVAQAILNELTKAEDTAREIRNRIRDGSGEDSLTEIERLANAVAQGFQAIRELL